MSTKYCSDHQPDKYSHCPSALLFPLHLSTGVAEPATSEQYIPIKVDNTEEKTSSSLKP